MALSTNTELKAAVADWLKRGDLTTQIPDFIRLAETAIERELSRGPGANDTYTTSAALTASQAWIYAPIGCLEPVHLRLETDPMRTLNVVSLRELTRAGQANTSGIPLAMAQVGNMRSGTITVMADGTGATTCTSADHGLSANDFVYISDASTDYDGRTYVTEVVDDDNFKINRTWVDNQAVCYWKTYQPKIMFDEAPASAYDYTLFYRAAFERLGEVEVSWLLSNHPDLILYGTLVTASPYLKNDARVPMWASFFQSALEGARKQQWRQRAGGGEGRVRVDFAVP
jgi:hypothetical protein